MAPTYGLKNCIIVPHIPKACHLSRHIAITDKLYILSSLVGFHIGGYQNFLRLRSPTSNRTNMQFVVNVSLILLIMTGIGRHFVHCGCPLPKLSKTQLKKIQAANESGLLGNIARELAQNGVIYENNTNFEPIFRLTPAQEILLNNCYRATPQERGSVQYTRNRRDTGIQESTSAHCIPEAEVNVDFIVDVKGENVMIVDSLSQPLSCELSKHDMDTGRRDACGKGGEGTCCAAEFPVNIVCWILGSLESLTIVQVDVKHCTCFNGMS